MGPGNKSRDDASFIVIPARVVGIQRLLSVMSYYVYILASRKNGTLYIGVTNDVARRVWEHRQGKGSVFARKYNVHRLVYVETHEDIEKAIQREKTMKEWPRTWKIGTIEALNPEWNDLYDEINH